MDKNSKIIFDDYHIHTNITDGLCTFLQIIEEAKKIGIKKIAFTEHVREILTYDWFKFRDEILNTDLKGIKVIVGIETKILNHNGKLDCNKDIFDSADIVLGSVHGAQSVEWLLNSDCDIIAHPQINASNVEKFLDCNKIIELNSKYPLIDEIVTALIKGNSYFSFGSDTHAIQDLKNGQEYFSKIYNTYKIKDKLWKCDKK